MKLMQPLSELKGKTKETLQNLTLQIQEVGEKIADFLKTKPTKTQLINYFNAFLLLSLSSCNQDPTIIKEIKKKNFIITAHRYTTSNDSIRLCIENTNGDFAYRWNGQNITSVDGQLEIIVGKKSTGVIKERNRYCECSTPLDVGEELLP